MTLVFCPDCWARNEPGDAHCRRCGAALADRGEAFFDKLVAALGHFEPGTRRRAASILGQIGDRRAVESLLRAAGDTDDPDLLEGAAEALGRIGGADAAVALRAALADGNASVHAAIAALEQVGGASGAVGWRSTPPPRGPARRGG